MPTSVFFFRVLDLEALLLFFWFFVVFGTEDFAFGVLEGNPVTVRQDLRRSRVGVTYSFRAVLGFGFDFMLEVTVFRVESHFVPVMDAGADQAAFADVDLLNFHQFNPRFFFGGRRRRAGARRRGVFGVAVTLPHAFLRTTGLTVATTLVDGAFVADGHVAAIAVDLDLDDDALVSSPLVVVLRLAFLLSVGGVRLFHTAACRTGHQTLGLTGLLVVLVVLLLATAALVVLLLVVLVAGLAGDGVHAIALQDGDAVVAFLVAMPQHRLATHVVQEPVIRRVIARASRAIRVRLEDVSAGSVEHLLFRTPEPVDDGLVGLVSGVVRVVEQPLPETMCGVRVGLVVVDQLFLVGEAGAAFCRSS